MDDRHLVFAADFPDDVQFSEVGDILVPAGREVAQAIVDLLERRECWCSEVTQRDYYAWEFRFRYRDTSVRAVLQRIDQWILTLSIGSLLRRLFSRKSICNVGVVAEIAQVLTDNLPCKGMVVYSEDDFPY
jgi:hypothetical protein